MAQADISGLAYFLPIFSFLLVFIIVYAVITRTKLLGDNKFATILVSFIVAIVFSTTAGTRKYVEAVTPWIVVLIVCLFFILLVIGMSQQKIQNIMKPGFVWFFVIAVLIIFLVAAFNVFSSVMQPFWSRVGETLTTKEKITGTAKGTTDYVRTFPARATEQVGNQVVDVAKTGAAIIQLPLSPIVHPVGGLINNVSYYTRFGINRVLDGLAAPSSLRFKEDKKERESFVSKTMRRLKQVNPISFATAPFKRAIKMLRIPTEDEVKSIDEKAEKALAERSNWQILPGGGEGDVQQKKAA